MPDPTQDSPATDDAGAPALVTVAQKIARGSDIQNYKATHVAPEKRALIEDMIKRGVGIVRTANETGSSANTVAVIRDQLIEREPELFKRHLAGNLQRIVNKTSARIEQGLDDMQEVKAGHLPGLSVSLGIIIDKLQVLSGDAPISVVEHRHKIDADSLSRLLESQQRSQRNDEIVVEAVEVTEVKPTT